MNYAEIVAKYSRMAEEKGMVNSLEGNLSMIDRATGNIYITPSHKAKSLLTPQMICVVDPSGEQIGGTGKKSSEFFLHEAAYKARPDCNAVFHCHTPYLSAYAFAYRDFQTEHGGIRYHNFSKLFHQGDWRSWYDFGMGALGDWGAHLIDTAHEFLNLGLPYEINMKYAKNHNEFFFPFSSTIEFRFGARGNMPPCDLIWYDGTDNQPPLPEGYGESKLADGIPASGQGEYTKLKLNPGKIIYGRDLTFKGASHGSTLEIIPKEKAEAMKDKLPEVPKSPSNHYVNFLRACQGTEKTRSPFQIAGVLCQVFCLGVIAQRLNTQLFFDPRTKKFTNNEFANAMLTGMPPRRGWEEYYKID